MPTKISTLKYYQPHSILPIQLQCRQYNLGLTQFQFQRHGQTTCNSMMLNQKPFYITMVHHLVVLYLLLGFINKLYEANPKGTIFGGNKECVLAQVRMYSVKCYHDPCMVALWKSICSLKSRRHSFYHPKNLFHFTVSKPAGQASQTSY